MITSPSLSKQDDQQYLFRLEYPPVVQELYCFLQEEGLPVHLHLHCLSPETYAPYVSHSSHSPYTPYGPYGLFHPEGSNFVREYKSVISEVYLSLKMELTTPRDNPVLKEIKIEDFVSTTMPSCLSGTRIILVQGGHNETVNYGYYKRPIFDKFYQAIKEVKPEVTEEQVARAFAFDDSDDEGGEGLEGYDNQLVEYKLYQGSHDLVGSMCEELRFHPYPFVNWNLDMLVDDLQKNMPKVKDTLRMLCK